jgi:hypothetical protein
MKKATAVLGKETIRLTFHLDPSNLK